MVINKLYHNKITIQRDDMNLPVGCCGAIILTGSKGPECPSEHKVGFIAEPTSWLSTENPCPHPRQHLVAMISVIY